MKEGAFDQLGPILTAYGPDAPRVTADALRDQWLRFEPKRMAGIKAEQREQQETVGFRSRCSGRLAERLERSPASV